MSVPSSWAIRNFRRRGNSQKNTNYILNTAKVSKPQRTRKSLHFIKIVRISFVSLSLSLFLSLSLSLSLYIYIYIYIYGDISDFTTVFLKYAVFRVVPNVILIIPHFISMCRGADKSLARPGRKQATATKL